jgi:hypothetical protein
MCNKCEIKPSEIVAHGQITSDSFKKESPKEGRIKNEKCLREN